MMSDNQNNIISIRVEKVTLDTSSNRFVVILKDDNNKRWLPIVVGPAEAQAIALQLEKVIPPRPMTHDLIKKLIEAMNAKVLKIEICDLKDNTYYATIFIQKNGSSEKIDARPSDAIALALRTRSPIFVNEDVMKRAAIGEEIAVIRVEEEDEIKALHAKMQEAVTEERYEDAARYRDLIHELEAKMIKEKKKKS